MRRLWLLLSTVALLGCAGGPASHDIVPPTSEAAVRATAARSTLPLPDGWLEESREAWPVDADECLVLAAALADDEGTWLWMHLDLDKRTVVRVAGPGALSVTLSDGERTWLVRDLGLHVPLHRDGNTYLNSESGPITIRSHHGLACDDTGVRFLARLPRIDVTAVEAVAVTAVEGRWTRRP